MSHIRKVAALCGAAVLLLGASACGGNGADPKAGGGTPEQGGPDNRRQDGPDGSVPGANGKVAAVHGRTAQVQGMDGQVAVTWTSATTFTRQVSAALSDVHVGDCVLVETGEAPSTSSTPATRVTATTVRIIDSTNGACGTGGPGAGGQDGGPGFSGPSPSDGPSGGTRPRVRAIAGTAGEVTAVAATGFTVASVMPGGDAGSDDTTPVTVTVDGDTTYTTTAKGAASDVKVGACVAASGATDQTGAVTARSIAVSAPRDGQCGGFVRLGGPGGGSGTGSQES